MNVDRPYTRREVTSLRARTAATDCGQPSAALVRTLHASLRATEVYARLLIDRIEAPRTTDAAQLTDVPAGAFVGLTSASDAVQHSIARFLGCLDPGLARRAEAIADLAHQSASPESDR